MTQLMVVGLIVLVLTGVWWMGMSTMRKQQQQPVRARRTYARSAQDSSKNRR